MKDKIGIFTSVLCLIHCIAFPLLFSILPALVSLDEPFEFMLLVIAFIIGTISMSDNIRKHKYIKPIVLFIIGFGLMGTSIYVHVHYLNLIGLLFLIIAHYINWKFIKKMDGCHPHTCKH